ncbi:hypothetical protein [Deinococcus sp.]|uniref:hypothetical protein n=1 Tax=Deinococcus sp. TaxID=47478 RepID=UPI002869D314|nr:hypothetical protein [Deinococcus sp.]
MTIKEHAACTPLHARLAHALLTGCLLLGSGTLAQTPAPDSAVLAMLAQAQPGSLYTMPGTLWDVCDRLAKAGLVAQGVGVTPRDQLVHVFYDATHDQYLSVLDGDRTVIRVSSQLPVSKEWIWAE